MSALHQEMDNYNRQTYGLRNARSNRSTGDTHFERKDKEPIEEDIQGGAFLDSFLFANMPPLKFLVRNSVSAGQKKPAYVDGCPPFGLTLNRKVEPIQLLSLA